MTDQPIPLGRTNGGSGRGEGTENPFGAGLFTAVKDACGGRLGEVTGFRTSWQRGGALTGYATYADDQGKAQAVVVKLPVSPRERKWLYRLQHWEGVVPRLLAHGETLGDYDFCWVVMERMPHGPLGGQWHGKEFDLIIEAVCRFYSAARHVAVSEPPPKKDWEKIFQMARANLQERDLIDEQRWKNALKAVHRKLPEWVKMWEDRPTDQWCHGDLHLANALTRVPPPEGPAVLIDFAEVHAGYWVEDAVYLEHLFWARRQKLDGRKICSQIAHERKRLGLPLLADWPKLASVRRGLLAMSTPAMLQHDGDKQHVHAALEVLEREIAGA